MSLWFLCNLLQMSLPPEVCVPPFEFPLPRAVQYDLLHPQHTPTDMDVYSICIVASAPNGTETTESDCGKYKYANVFHEIEDRHTQYNAHGGFVFTKESIALRMHSMDRVLCWFGFHGGIKYTCYVSKVGCDHSTSSE